MAYRKLSAAIEGGYWGWCVIHFKHRRALNNVTTLFIIFILEYVVMKSCEWHLNRYTLRAYVTSPRSVLLHDNWCSYSDKRALFSRREHLLYSGHAWLHTLHSPHALAIKQPTARRQQCTWGSVPFQPVRRRANVLTPDALQSCWSI